MADESGSIAGDPRANEDLPMELRRERIAELAQESHFVTVTEISHSFGVSPVTARGDLQALEEQGRLRRVRGGAIAAAQAGPTPEQAFVQSLGASAEEKARIGEAAAKLVMPGEAVFLDVGTTTTAVAQALADRDDLTDVTVFTNSITIAVALEAVIPRMSVVLTGGTLRPLQYSLVDPLGDTILERINVDTVFLGCNGVHPTKGVTNINLPEAVMKRRMIKASRRRVVVADGKKIGAISLAFLCGIDDVDLLITGASADPATVGSLRDRGLEVQMAS